MEQQIVVARQINGESVEEAVILPDAAPHANEGKTAAAWTLTWVCSIGCAIIAVAMILALPVWIWIGVAVTVLGGIASAVLRAVGHGQPRITKDGDVVA